MAPFRLPPKDDDDTDPEGGIPTRVEIPVTSQVDTLIAATHRGFMDADRKCNDRLAGARARGQVSGIVLGAALALVALASGVFLFWLLRGPGVR